MDINSGLTETLLPLFAWLLRYYWWSSRIRQHCPVSVNLLYRSVAYKLRVGILLVVCFLPINTRKHVCTRARQPQTCAHAPNARIRTQAYTRPTRATCTHIGLLCTLTQTEGRAHAHECKRRTTIVIRYSVSLNQVGLTDCVKVVKVTEPNGIEWL